MALGLKPLSADIKNLKEMQIIQVKDKNTKKFFTGLLHRVDKNEGLIYLARCCPSDEAIDADLYRGCSKAVRYEPLIPITIRGNLYRLLQV
jgi:fructoselysine-6-P-deglycase FrlB-like protein